MDMELRVVPIDDSGNLELDAYDQLIDEETGLVGVCHVSNALGTVNPVEEIVELAHSRDVPVLVDGCQAVPHRPVDVGDLGADFYAFSGHKMNAPTGIGVLYATGPRFEEMRPFQGGGDMIKRVSFEKTTFNDLPYRFEAGTPAIMPAVGLGAAASYLSAIGMERIERREAKLLDYATDKLASQPGIEIVGRADEKASVLSFTMEGVHPHDIGTILDTEGVAIRAGHHCAQPVMERYDIPATARASFSYYNTTEDADRLVEAIDEVRAIFG
jgi:cysteine desulfurase/selenocysteine lyase